MLWYIVSCLVSSCAHQYCPFMPAHLLGAFRNVQSKRDLLEIYLLLWLGKNVCLIVCSLNMTSHTGNWFPHSGN